MTGAPRARAFTLVEIAIVCATVAILAAIAAPRFHSASTRYRVDAAANRIAGDVALAQQEAISSSSSRTLTFTSTTRSYTMTGTGALNPSGTTYTVKLADPPYHASSLGAVVNGAATTPLIFDGFGKPNAAGTITVRVGSEQRTITVEAETGRTQVN